MDRNALWCAKFIPRSAYWGKKDILLPKEFQIYIKLQNCMDLIEKVYEVMK